METQISSATKEVIISDERPTVLIGERINPAGKKNLAEELRNSNLDMVRQEAKKQVEAGADVLDVNVSTFGVDETSLLPMAVQEVMTTVDVPLCLDSANPKALEAALKVYKGKALINSVTGEKLSLERVLPLVKKYEAAVIGLVQDDEGPPKDAKQRIKIAKTIVERAEAMGIPREDVVIDCLSMAVGAMPAAGLAVIEAARGIKEELGVNLTLAASNVSFGMPNRQLLNSVYMTMAIEAGVNCLILDAASARPTVLAADLILHRDGYARRYLGAHRRNPGTSSR